jgi:hypothetical protein
MTTVYGIYVIQLGCESWLAELTDALTAELEAIGLHKSISVLVSETPFADDVPCVCVYMGDRVSAADESIKRRAGAAVDAGLVVIPAVEALSVFSTSVPECLQAINGFGWEGVNPAERLVRNLLEELGIEDRQRRVFISHKREDGLGAAEQLHDRLTHQRFLPFIDRFAIPTGERMQDAIADALEDHAFLLLLETPQAHLSEWVFDEVEYALSHAMGTMIVSWPGNPKPVPASNRLPRFTLASEDLTTDDHGYEVLTDEALERVIETVEAAHAEGIVRRRVMLARSVEEAALAAGCVCVPQSAWRLLIKRGGEATLVGVTPRLPKAQDLQDLDEARVRDAADARALLVHSARALSDSLQAHLRWVAGERELTLGPENAVGGQWK